MLGRTLRHYRIESKLGEGGMGVVYRALDTHLDRPVAIKILPPEAVANLERKRRFVQEAKAASALSHTNIVVVHDVDTAEDIHFIVMEYVPGKPLDRIIGRKGLGLREALDYSIQLADALSAAHHAGIVHRDLKPPNIMVNDNGHVKLLDFGLAKLTEPLDSGDAGMTCSMNTKEQRTAEGTIVGTVSYMSPEQAEGKSVDARSDIFSFGSVLYEMVTGRRAFQEDSRLATLSAILHSEPVSLSEANGIPHDLQKIVSRCLRKDAARRFQHTDDLKIALQEVVEQLDSGSSPSHAQPRKSRIVPLAVGTVAILVAGAVLWVGRYRMTPREAPLNAIPLTTYPGRERYPTFSPDGSQIAFTWDGEKQNTDIYVKAIGAGEPLRLTVNPARDFAPVWSPDGRFIAFAREIGPDWAAILQIPALGGAERKLGQALWTSSDVWGFVLSWSPDGKHLVIPDRKTPQEPTGLFAFVLATGEKRSLTDPPVKSIGDSNPATSPDGRFLAFSRSPSYAVSDLWVLSLSEDFTPKGEPRQLTSDHRQVNGCAWTPDGREIVFASNRTGSRALWRIAASGSGTPVRLASVGEGAVSPAIARAGAGQGTRLAYALAGPARDIHRLDVQKGIETQLISSTRDDANAQYSPDGSRIAFISDQSGANEVWVSQGDGSNRQPLTSFRGPITDLPSWSPDGLRIAFHSRPEGTADIYVIDADGGAPRRLTTEPSDDIAPTWSRDGRWIYFGSNRSGDHQIWRLPASGGVAVQVTRNGGIFAQESHDGRFLFYTKTRGVTGLWKTHLSEGTAMGPESQVAGAIYYLNFAVRPEGVYFSPGGPIQFLPLTGGPLVSFGAKTGEALLSVSPDRKFFLYSVSRSTSDLMLVENFR